MDQNRWHQIQFRLIRHLDLIYLTGTSSEQIDKTRLVLGPHFMFRNPQAYVQGRIWERR